MRAVLRLPVVVNVLVTGLYNSALERAWYAKPSTPPATSTVPLFSSVAVWNMRAVARLPVRVKLAVATAKVTLLLTTPPTVTTTLPVVAPGGTGTVTLEALQLLGVAVVPLKVTVLVPWVAPKFVPAMVTCVPTTPLIGVRLEICGDCA